VYDRNEHYLIERELADRLRVTPQQERARAFGEVYDELFRRVPGHPQLSRKCDASATQRELNNKLRLVSRFLRPDTAFLEIGAGDCALSFAVAARVRSVTAVDVSETVTDQHAPPANFRLLLTDGVTLPLPDCSVTLVYSNQLMEHIHPDDARQQLAEVRRVLVPGGGYLLITPSRLTGPHDISRYYDDRATGFHLREYSRREVGELLREAGFARQRTYIGGRGRYLTFPTPPAVMAESAFEGLPRRLRRRVRRNPALLALFGVVVYAQR
jgi:SAM-dependent methyltransferase